MVFTPGPIFSNIVLADEINRTPPKTQSALLEAMQEHRVTVQGKTYELDEPFFVFATQNPIELEGTYPLPEAQLDRFMFQVDVDYPSEAEEEEIVQAVAGHAIAWGPNGPGPLSAASAVRLAHQLVESESIALSRAPGVAAIPDDALASAGVLDEVKAWRARRRPAGKEQVA
jgi:MoxR-like ATPase